MRRSLGVRVARAVASLIRDLLRVAGAVLALVAIVYVLGSPALLGLLKAVAVGALKLAAVFLAAGAGLALLHRWRTTASEKADGLAQLLEYASRYVPLRFIASVPELVFAPTAQLQELASRRRAWASAALLLLACVGASTGVEKLLHLPPTELSAAASIYLVAFDLEERGESQPGAAIADILARIGEAGGAGTDAVSRKLADSILPLRLALQLESEVYCAVVYPGLSVLNLYLEWTSGVRAASDLDPHYAADTAERASFTRIRDRWQQERLVDRLTVEAVTLAWPLAFALLLWIGVRGLRWRVALGASLYLFAALLLSYEFVYVVASTVVTLGAAELLAWLGWLVVLELWVFAVLPSELHLSEGRCALVGNASMLVLQAAGMAIERLVFLV